MMLNYNLKQISYKFFFIPICLLLAALQYSNAQTASFTFTTPGDSCDSRPIRLDASSSTGNITSYDWTITNPAGVVSPVFSGTPANRNLLSPGTYQITLTVKGPGGTNSTTQNVRVYKNPQVNFTANETVGCAVHKVIFTDNSTAGDADATIKNWTWDYGDVSKDVFFNKVNPTHNYVTPSKYKVVLIAENNFGCRGTAVKEDYITVNSSNIQPKFSVSNNTSCTFPHTVTFTNTSVIPPPIQYTWDWGDGSTPEPNNNPTVTHAYTQAGVFEARLEAANGTACRGSAVTQGADKIYIGKPVPDFKSPQQACTNQTIYFSALPDLTRLTNEGIWKFSDDNSTASGTGVYHTFTKPGTHTITYTASNSFSKCSDVKEKTIDVATAPAAGFTIDFPNGCKVPHTVTITNTSTNAIEYVWDFGDGNGPQVINASSFTYPFDKFSYYGVSLKARNADCESSPVYKYVYVQKPTVDFLYDPKEGCKPLTVNVRAQVNSIDPITEYIWSFGGNTKSTLTGNTNYTFTDAGTFDIVLTIRTAQNCIYSSLAKQVVVADICEDDGAGGGGGGGGGGAGFEISKTCADKYTIVFKDTTSNCEVVSWDFGDGDIRSTSQNPITKTFTPPQKKFVVVVTTKDKTTAAIKTATKRVVIIDEKADFEPSLTAICKNLTVNFATKNIDSSNIAFYTWDFGNDKPRQIINNKAYYAIKNEYLNGNTQHQYIDTGVFYPKLIIQDKLGCKDSITYPQPIVVRGPLAGFSIDKNTFCKQKYFLPLFLDTSKTNGTVPIAERKWSFNDGKSDYVTTLDTPITRQYNAGWGASLLYTIKLMIKDDNGCADTVQQNIQAFTPKVDFISYDTLHCGKFNVIFNNYSNAAVKNYYKDYVWDYGDGSISTGDYSSFGQHVYKDTGRYTIRLMVTDSGGCKDTMEKAAYIKLVKPKADFIIGADTSKCVGTFTLSFKDSSTYAKSYVWDFGNGNSLKTDKLTASWFYADADTYSVKLKIIGLDKCEDSITKPVRIKGPNGKLSISDDTLCLGNQLNALITGKNISQYYWDFDDGTSTDQLNAKNVVEHQYKGPGKYLPTVILQSPEGCTITRTPADSVIVDAVKADFSADKTNFCGQSVVSFSNLTQTAPFSNVVKYEWDFDDGATYNNFLPPPHLFTQAKAYAVTLKATSLFGCSDTATKKAFIVVSQPPALAIKADSNLCVGNQKLLQSLISYDKNTDSITSYKWLINGLSVGKDSTLNYSFNNSQLYSIQLDVNTKNKCLVTDNKTINVHPLPVPNAAPDTVICYGTPVLLKASDGTKYKWTPVVGLQDANNATTLANPVASTKYWVNVTNKYGCEKTDTVNIVVDEKVGLKKMNDAVVCEGKSVQLQAKAKVSQFKWFPADGLNNDAIANPISIPSVTTQYSVVAYSTNTCSNDTGTVIVKVAANPTVEVGNGAQVVAGTPITLQPVVSSNVVSYNWSPAKGLNCYNCAAPVFIADNNITYKLTVTTQEGCTATDTITYMVTCNKGAVYIPNSFSPNNDCNNDIWYVKGYGFKNIKRISIYDRWGKEVFKQYNCPVNDPKYGWNGFMNNRPIQSTTTFVYLIELICIGTNEPIQLKGTITAVL